MYIYIVLSKYSSPHEVLLPFIIHICHSDCMHETTDSHRKHQPTARQFTYVEIKIHTSSFLCER